jgi:hypothetical protein
MRNQGHPPGSRQRGLASLPFAIGERVRVRATGAVGTVEEISVRRRTMDVDLGDGIVAEFTWDEIEEAPAEPLN